MPAMIWRGAISFGLVHVPVRLVPATRTVKPSFRMLDRRSLDPIGYRRVNKRTGREVAREDIVRGYEYEKERYVVLGDDEIQAANPESTQSVDILTFVDTSAVSFLYLDTPYYLLPERNGEKVYALLRDALAETGRVGIALVVMRERQHLAALIPVGEVLALDTLRWQDELRGLDELSAGKGGKRGASASAQERRMARKLIEDMSGDWAPDEYHDTFRDDILALVERKVKAGKTKTIETPHADAPAKTSSNVLDLTELLRRSLGGGGRRAGKDAEDGEAGRVKRGKAAGRKAAAGGKPAARTAAKPVESAKSARAARATKANGASGRAKPAAKSAGKPAAKTAAKTAAKKDAKAGASRKSTSRATSAAPASRKRAA